eukprot:SAG11_NODE_36305_length_262_cov_0.742331_1_plen_72_part_10
MVGVGFLVVNVFWLNILIGGDNSYFSQQLGMIFNAIIAAVSFLGLVITAVMIKQVADDCPSGQSCSSWAFTG